MEWWDRMVFPMKQAWIRVALRFRVRKTGKHLKDPISNIYGSDLRRSKSDESILAPFFSLLLLGLWKLRQEVSTCEYEDVHVMWEILQRTDMEISTLSRRRRSGARWSVFESGPHRLCGSF
ncbi:hypothetical protein MA16_Dca018110 [Dendrobium catenatum]|uniref:Uncharacterized protein n=1 Tax=Dendrobium catenatum TaxID=906689 RepID=A0A2I0WH96_9ASPA|nr:hypothetical protein MA16_Dca018110 [Dendrobium catenatum]